ncbi:MAG: 5'-deoxynucleotidase [Aristaeellaceae bacterium]
MHHFFAYMARLRHIRRWGLMRSALPENDAEHSLQVAMLAHGLAVLARDRYHRAVEPEHVLALAVYHDATEVITGDMPTPVKYHSDALRGAYRALEDMAAERLTAMLPESMQPSFAPYLRPEEDEAWQLVKAADKISAYVKCVEEQRAGNHEFDAAGENIRASLEAMNLPEVRDFMAEFVPSFALTLDELNRPGGAS